MAVQHLLSEVWRRVVVASTMLFACSAAHDEVSGAGDGSADKGSSAASEHGTSSSTTSSGASSSETTSTGSTLADSMGLETGSSSSSGGEADTSTGLDVPVCGDGVVEGEETCDDGNEEASDGCKLCAKDSVVFATSEVYQGSKLNGLDGADQRCRMLAAIAGLERFATYRAWLSDSGMSAAERLLHSRGRYVLVNGLVVAEDWEGLTSGTLLRGIDVDENSETRDATAWTGSLPNGERAAGSTFCDDWTDHSMGQKAGWGVTDEASMYWSFVNNSDCGSESTLYCIEQ